MEYMIKNMTIPRSILFSTLLVLLQSKINSQLINFICDTASNYSSNDTFATNLDLLLSSLMMKTPQTGFFNDTKGLLPNRVYGLALCRGDISSEYCMGCLKMASRDMPNLCPYNKGSTAWYNRCLVRYGISDFFSDLDESPSIYYYNVTVSDPTQFEDRLVMMIESISKIAAYNASNRYFATGQTNVSGSMVIYGMVQCTRDLSVEQCFKCLNDSLGVIVTSFYGIDWAMALSRSCVLRYESDPFFSSDPTWVAPPSLVPMPVSPIQAPQPINLMKKGKSNRTVTIALGVGLPLLLLSALAIFLFICLKRRKTTRNRINQKNILENVKGGKSMVFEFSILQQATDNFSDLNKLGEGGFGPVYKGKLLDGREIAVKRLSKGSNQGMCELANEVKFLAELQHKNLVRLFGVCMEKKEMLLVYEYIRNKSLDTVIFDDARGRNLNWEERLKIIQGISRGLLYLHQDSAIRIIHRDLKASNILLDENLNPKISDFGLARLLGGDCTQSKTSKVVGTYGYMAPEYAVQGTVSTKVDVFSFGVLIMEIISGKSSSSFAGTSAGNLLNYAWEHWTNGTATELIDLCLSHETRSSHEAVRCINIALLCVQKSPDERPNIFSVNLMLTRKRMQIPPPSSPAFALVDSNLESTDFETSYSSPSTSSVKYTINEVSCTGPYPR